MFGVIRSGSGSMFRCSCSGILLYSASPCSALPWPDEPALPFHALACMQEEAYNVMSMEPRTVAEAVSERCLRVVLDYLGVVQVGRGGTLCVWRRRSRSDACGWCRWWAAPCVCV